MPLITAQVTDPADFDVICPMDHDAWLTPYNPQLKHFRPVFPTREESIAYVKTRSTTALENADPNRFMIKVTDDETGEIIGFASWEVNDPTAKGKNEAPTKTLATWHPQGSEQREFAEIFIDGLWGFLASRVDRPHMDLHSIVVHIAHRHRGAGRLLIRWGTAKADELGIETVVSSLASARGAYEKCGLGCIEVIPPDPKLVTRLEELEKERENGKPGAGLKWKELLEDDLSGYLMWRPVGRDWRDGDKAPWKEL